MNEINVVTLDSVERVASAAQQLAEKLQQLMLCDEERLNVAGFMVQRKVAAFNSALYDLNMHATPIHLDIWGYVKQREREISK